MAKKKGGDDSDGGGEMIAKPHPHDVLCGRGGLTNQHTGNEWFRRLVRSNRPLYRSCPKHTKLLVAKAIVQAVQQQEPAGRFLELADRNEGLWRQISYKRAVDKTSQALREKDPPPSKGGGAMPAMNPPLQVPDSNIQSEAAAAAAKAAARKGKRKEEDLSDLAQATLKQAGFIGDKHQKVTPASAILPPPVDLGKKRKPAPKPDFIKPSWWGRTSQPEKSDNDGSASQPAKKMKTGDAPPPPTEPLQTRQSSLFRFLSNTSIFGGGGGGSDQQPQQQASNSFFSFSSGNNNAMNNTMNNMNNSMNNNRDPGDMISQEAAAFQQFNNNNRMSFSMPPPVGQNLQQMGSSTYLLDPIPINGQQQQPQDQRQNSLGSQPDQIQQMQRQMQERMQQMQQHMQQQMQMQMEQFRRASYENNGMNPMMNNINNKNNSNMMPGGINNINNNNQNNVNCNPRNSLRTSFLDERNAVFANNPGMDNPQAAFQNNAMASGSQQQDDDAPPPVNRLSSQVSDWLTSFWPLGKDGNEAEQPPPPAENLERSVSSTLINFARSPSQFLSTLKSGVSSMFGENNNNNNQNSMSGGMQTTNNNSNMMGNNAMMGNNPSMMGNNVASMMGSNGPPMMANVPSFNPSVSTGSAASSHKPPVIGTESRGNSLLDDYEESPMETRLRTGISG